MSIHSFDLSIRNIQKSYVTGEARLQALRDVTFQIRNGGFLALAGTSGSGKTSLLNLIGCLDRPDSGSILCGGQDLCAMDDQEQTQFRARHLGFIFQHFNLIPVLSALENVEYGLIHAEGSEAERREKSLAALNKVGLGSHLNHRPGQLSGGQNQRVAIARAIVKRPPLVIADEPTASLDKRTAQGILDLMRSLNETENITFVFSSHDPLVLEQARTIVHMSDGQIEKIEER